MSVWINPYNNNNNNNHASFQEDREECTSNKTIKLIYYAQLLTDSLSRIQKIKLKYGSF